MTTLAFLVSQLVQAAATDCHKLGGLRTRRISLSQLWEVQDQDHAGMGELWGGASS